jgi:hypothetical protein
MSEATTAIAEALPMPYLRTVTGQFPDRSHVELEVQVTECLKYLALISLTRGRRIPVTPDVDDVWHQLIVQTRAYERLCAHLPGARFVHHESITPQEYSSRVGDEVFVREFVQWVPDYVQSFGEFTERAAARWTVVAFLRGEMGMSLDEVNELGASSPAEALLPAGSPWRALGALRSLDELYGPAAA